MKKVEIINVIIPDYPKNHDHLVVKESELYSEKVNAQNESLSNYFDESSKLIKIEQDYHKADEKLSKILSKYYFLKLFSKASDKTRDFNNKMLTIDKYINQIKKYFFELKKMRNAFQKKNIPTENDLKYLFYKISDFLDIEKDIENELANFERENYPKIKMTSYNLCKDKGYKELEKLSLEVNSIINNYKSLEEAYDYVCYNSSDLIYDFIETVVEYIKDNPKKSKLKLERNYFFEDEVVMFVDYFNWIELFSKIQYLKNKVDKSVFTDETISSKYHNLEINYLIVLIYNAKAA